MQFGNTEAKEGLGIHKKNEEKITLISCHLNEVEAFLN